MADITHRDIKQIVTRLQDRIVIADNARKDYGHDRDCTCDRCLRIGKHEADLCAINAELRGLTANNMLTVSGERQKGPNT